MPSVSRRGFLRSTGLTLAAAGALGALAPMGAMAAGMPQQPGPATSMPVPIPMQPVASVNLAGGEPFVVYVSDPATGAGSILVGERSIPFANGAIVQTLQQVMA